MGQCNASPENKEKAFDSVCIYKSDESDAVSCQTLKSQASRIALSVRSADSVQTFASFGSSASTESQRQRVKLPASIRTKSMDRFSKHYSLDVLDESNVIGRGSNAVVRRGSNIETGNIVAVKCFAASDLFTRNDAVSRLQKEIHIMRELSHPFICTFYDVYKSPPNAEVPECKLVLEYCESGSLQEYITAAKVIPETKCKKIIAQILSAIVYIHSLNVVHRDIKPDNLLLTCRSGGTLVKLCDFGMATVCEGDVLDQGCGSPEFIAPEVWAKVPYGLKVDVWALGVIAYILENSESPFKGKNLSEMSRIVQIEKHVHYNKSSKSQMRFIDKLLVKDPAQRPSAEECSKFPWVANYFK